MAGFKPFTGAAASISVTQAAHTTKCSLGGSIDYTNPGNCPSSTDDLGRVFWQWGIGAFIASGPVENSTGLLGFGFYDKFTLPGPLTNYLGGGNIGYTNSPELAADTTYQYRCGVDVWYITGGSPGYGYSCTRYGSTLSFKTDAVTAIASAPSSSAITSNSANISANYNANTGVSGCTALLQYKRNVDVGWTDAGVADVAASGYAVQAVNRALTGLVASTLYDVRLVLTRTTNNGTTVTSTTSQFTTLAGQPTIATGAASGMTGTTATLNGTVNPNGTATTYRFQYGLTTAYGSTTAVQGPSSVSAAFAFTAAISGLTANRVYHFRAMATQAAVDYFGADMAFSTDTQGHIMPTVYEFLAKYGVAADFGFCVETPSATGSDRFLNAPVTWVAGDVKIIKDFGASANVTALPTRVATTPLYKASLTAAEMSANQIDILLVAAATPPSWRDCHLQIKTRLLLGQIDVDATQIGGNTSAMSLVGVGTGYGLYAKGSSGIKGEAQGTSGTGIQGVGIGGGHGFQGTGGTGGQPCNFFDIQEGAELVSGDFTDNMTMKQIVKVLKVRETNKVTQTSTAQTWYKNDSTTVLRSRTVADDLVTQTQNKLY